MRRHFLPYMIIGALAYFYAQWLMRLTNKTFPSWTFIPIWIVGLFLVAATFLGGGLIWAFGCYLIVRIQEFFKKKEVNKKQLKERNSMSKNKNVVEASGVIGQVYKTKKGMEVADPYKDCRGWKQISPTTRRLVESHDLPTHERWAVWREINKKEE